jgi:hypothetical protein
MNKEQIEKLIDDANLSSTASFRIREWFAQNTLVSTETKVVGLNDSQVKALGKVIHQKSMNLTLFEAETLVESWLKNQTFTEPKQFAPNWENISGDVVGVLYEVSHYNKFGDKVYQGKYEEQRPAPPAPKVEVGQVWRLNNSESRVEVLLIRGGDVAVDSLDVGGLAVYEITDFVAKFERVGGSE